jgi:hypothetical protein
MATEKKLRRLLEKIFDSCRQGLREELSPAEYSERKFDFVFHMTDFLADYKRMEHFFEHPEKAKLKEASPEVIGFLYHVVPHLKAAGRLLLDHINDPFEDIPAAPKARKKIKTKAG